MRVLRRLAARLLRGPDADFVRHDLDDLYARDRAGGMSSWRAHVRYAHALIRSALSSWTDDRRGLRLRVRTMLRDFRFALRLFRKHPAPVVIATGGLAIAIGVVTAVFSLVNATVLRPYGMDDPGSVVKITDASHGRGWPFWSYSQFLTLQREATLARVEASLAARVQFSTTRADEVGPSRRAQFVSGGYLSTLGGRPLHGRALEMADAAPGAPPVIVASHHFWATQLGGDPSIVGTTAWVNGSAVTLVGVLRPDFTGPIEYDVRPSIWAPLASLDDVRAGPAITPTSGPSVEVIARLVSGASMRAAQDNLAAIVARTRPARSTAPGRTTPEVLLYSAASPIAESASEADVVTGLASVLGVTALVLALACANTANLLLAAAVTRRREIGVRLALGASTRRLVEQLVHESVLLALVAGGLGFGLAMGMVPLFAAIVEVPAHVNLAPDGRVLVFAIVVAIVCGLGAGLSPARHGARGDVLAALQSQGGSRGSAFVPSRLRTSFVGFQAAVSIVLLVFAALLGRTAWSAVRGGAGFDTDRLIIVSPRPQRAGLDRAAYTQQAVEALRRLPSVERVSVAESEPLGSMGARDRVTADGRSFALRTAHTDAEFLATAGVPLLRGRTFTDDEVRRGAPIVIVSDAVARALFGERDPVGQTLPVRSTAPDRSTEAVTIIGVAANALIARPEGQWHGVIYRPLQSSSEPRIFTLDGFPIPPSLLVRASNLELARRGIDDALRRVDPSVRPSISLVSERLETYLGGKRMLAWLSGPIAVLALLLAVLGVYGVTAFVVGQRREEVSVRLAIGASAADVRRLLVRDSLRPVVIGLTIGLAIALAGSRVSASMLMLTDISANDPLSIGLAVALVLGFAFAAVIVPARRASKMDPAGVLRQA